MAADKSAATGDAANQKMAVNPDEYSPEVTLIKFERPIPLLRESIPTAAPNDPCVLAFKDPQSWASAYKACESQIIQQCENGARIGCSVSASSKCAPPWWKTLTGGGVSKEELVEREKCEEREMAACLEASRTKCRKFATDKCLPAFREAKIVVKISTNEVLKNQRPSVVELISRAFMAERRIAGFEVWRLDGSWSEFKSQGGYRICKGSDLLENLD